jgi:hypothetical protein
MKHHQLPSNKDQRLSKNIEKGDYSNKKKEKKMSTEDSLAETPKVGRTSDKNPSNKRLDSEKHLSNKNLKHLKTFEGIKISEASETVVNKNMDPSVSISKVKYHGEEHYALSIGFASGPYYMEKYYLIDKTYFEYNDFDEVERKVSPTELLIDGNNKNK